MNSKFQFYRTPRIFFGPGQRKQLHSLLVSFGSPALLFHSTHSLPEDYLKNLAKEFHASGITIFECLTSGEPSPEYIDSIVSKYRNMNIKAVIAIGGGSVIDTGKAVSAMLLLQEPINNYLEVIGNKNHPGIKVPFFALPTTAGTGSEASANAVLSETGEHGFKRSIRHENLVPDFAIIDPELMLSCPEKITAACGMDALTQLLESYVSPKASLLTDSLIEKALPLISENLIPASSFGKSDIHVRTAMSYAALVSGITLANAGLGIVHGLASSIGGLYPIPHGVVCGTLLAFATIQNIKKLRSCNHSSNALEKYGHAGFLLTGKQGESSQGCDLLIQQLTFYTEKLSIPKLSKYGVSKDDLKRIVRDCSNKNNPIELSDEEISSLILERI